MLYPAYEGEMNVNPGAVSQEEFHPGRNTWIQSGKESFIQSVQNSTQGGMLGFSQGKSPLCGFLGLASGGWTARLCFRIQAIKKLPEGSFLKLNGKVVTSD